MLWVRTLSVFLPSLLSSPVDWANPSVGDSTGDRVSTVASRSNLRMIILPWVPSVIFEALAGNTAQFCPKCPSENRVGVWGAKNRLYRRAVDAVDNEGQMQMTMIKSLSGVCAVLLLGTSLARADDMASMVSDYRHAHGLSAVKTDAQLTAVAERQAEAMAKSG